MRTRWARTLGWLLTTLCIFLAHSPLATAQDCNGQVVTCTASSSGIEVGLGKEALGNLAGGRDAEGVALKASYKYASVVTCGNNTPAQPQNVEPMCTGAVSACAGNTKAEGQGPLTTIFRRELDKNGKPKGGWQAVGTTCFPDLAPKSTVLSIGQIIDAFRRTPFAKPQVHIQPEGNTTLVTLPTYFEAQWPAAGFQPGEVDTADPAQMLGHTVRIRPLAAGYTYTFGDGTHLGPTDSPGGTYPDGDIRHAYERAGTYNTQISVTYGGEFSIDGGAWIRIPATATVAGPTQPLRVRTAHNRLYNN